MTRQLRHSLGAIALLLAACLVFTTVGIVPVAAFIVALFTLTGVGVVLWIRDIYLSEQSERAHFDRLRHKLP
ncbi:hypothetical protein [Corynebacterium tapiri]|uniref:Uncharacterized protein n=1 Tax=Corynebacterium tapiri TaxID=1448266 RepID=A0A5C4U1J7_9CORY|nr:hypothetical protein [Corynebacterium tapiri]TNL95358.1 hypothetical protein FHE74_09755 [Corynebacterium tapiri]